MIADKTHALQFLAANKGRVSFGPGDEHNLEIRVEIVLNNRREKCARPLPVKWIESNLAGAVFVCLCDLLRIVGSRKQRKERNSQ